MGIVLLYHYSAGKCRTVEVVSCKGEATAK